MAFKQRRYHASLEMRAHELRAGMCEPGSRIVVVKYFFSNIDLKIGGKIFQIKNYH
jgi:hypothetical protein